MRSLWILLMALLTGCSTHLSDYRETSPTLKMEEFFNGDLIAWGLVQNRSGKVLRRFRVEMTGTWRDNKGTLDEHFVYDDGEKQRRVWHLEKQADGSYHGKADDVSSPAQGQTQGFALNWHYTLALEVDGDTWDIDFDDWMYLIDEKRLINRAEMSKWGFKVGEVTLWIEKRDESSSSIDSVNSINRNAS